MLWNRLWCARGGVDRGCPRRGFKAPQAPPRGRFVWTGCNIGIQAEEKANDREEGRSWGCREKLRPG